MTRTGSFARGARGASRSSARRHVRNPREHTPASIAEVRAARPTATPAGGTPSAAGRMAAEPGTPVRPVAPRRGAPVMGWRTALLGMLGLGPRAIAGSE